MQGTAGLQGSLAKLAELWGSNGLHVTPNPCKKAGSFHPCGAQGRVASWQRRFLGMAQLPVLISPLSWQLGMEGLGLQRAHVPVAPISLSLQYQRTSGYMM